MEQHLKNLELQVINLNYEVADLRNALKMFLEKQVASVSEDSKVMDIIFREWMRIKLKIKYPEMSEEDIPEIILNIMNE